jgi:hypothetical protein
VESRKQRLDFAAAALEQRVKHSALRNADPAADTFGIFVALDQYYFVEKIRQRSRRAHPRDSTPDYNCASLDHWL